MLTHRRHIIRETKEHGRSFRLFTALVGSRLGTIRDLVVWWTVRVLAMWLEVLVIVVIAIWVIVAVLRTKLMHLLWTRSKLIWTTIASSHWH